ncbi:MAG: hypothetical protein AB7O92_24725 [Acidimicrobiia bacterium]
MQNTHPTQPTNRPSRLKHTVAAIALGGLITGAGIAAVAVVPAFAGAVQADSPAGGQGTAPNAGPLEDALAPLVADGTLTQEQADAVAEALRATAEARADARSERRAALVDAAAQYFGISAEELQARWQDGESLATIAEDTGHSRDDLIATLVAAVGERTGAAVAAGAITEEQAQRIEDRAPELIERLVDVPGGELGERVGGRIGARIAERRAR